MGEEETEKGWKETRKGEETRKTINERKNAGRKEVRKGNIKVKGEIRKQGRKKCDVNKALNGDTGKPEDDQLTEGGGGVESQRSSSGEVEASAGSP